MMIFIKNKINKFQRDIEQRKRLICNFIKNNNNSLNGYQ